MSERPNNRTVLERRMFVAGLAATAALPLAHAQTAATPPQTLVAECVLTVLDT